MKLIVILLGILSFSCVGLKLKSTNETINPPHTQSEPLAEYNGGPIALSKYIYGNLRYPETAKKEGIEGKVYLTFTVEANGSLSNIKILKGLEGGCTEEAIRLIKHSGKWNPAVKKGRPVRSEFTMPVNFVLKIADTVKATSK